MKTIRELLEEKGRDAIEASIEEINSTLRAYGLHLEDEREVLKAINAVGGVEKYRGKALLTGGAVWLENKEDNLLETITYRISDDYKLPEDEPDIFWGEFVFVPGNFGDYIHYRVPWSSVQCSIQELPYISNNYNWAFLGYVNEQSQFHCTISHMYQSSEGIKYKKFAMFEKLKDKNNEND